MKLLYVKYGLVGMSVLGIFVLAAIGQIPSTQAVTDVTTVVGALVVALGLVNRSNGNT
jgi:hypothetical protein